MLKVRDDYLRWQACVLVESHSRQHRVDGPLALQHLQPRRREHPAHHERHHPVRCRRGRSIRLLTSTAAEDLALGALPRQVEKTEETASGTSSCARRHRRAHRVGLLEFTGGHHHRWRLQRRGRLHHLRQGRQARPHGRCREGQQPRSLCGGGDSQQVGESDSRDLRQVPGDPSSPLPTTPARSHPFRSSVHTYCLLSLTALSTTSTQWTRPGSGVHTAVIFASESTQTWSSGATWTRRTHPAQLCSDRRA